MRHHVIQLMKYLPAALFGLLIVVWIWELFFVNAMYFRMPFTQQMWVVAGDNGTLVFSRSAKQPGPTIWFLKRNDRPTSYSVGRLRGEFKGIHDFRIYFPIPALLTLLFPLAVGPLVRFQFPLWSWFVFVAVLAGECAYYATS